MAKRSNAGNADKNPKTINAMPLPDLLTAFFPVAQKKRTLPPANMPTFDLSRTGGHDNSTAVPLGGEELGSVQQQAALPGEAMAAPTQPSATAFYPQAQPPPDSRYDLTNHAPSDGSVPGSQAYFPVNQRMAEQAGTGSTGEPMQMQQSMAPTMEEPDALEAAYREREGILKDGPKRESKLWKRLLGGALRGMAAGGQGGGIEGALSGAAVGAVGEGFFPSLNQKMRVPQNVARVNQQIAGLEQEKKLKSDQKRREAELQNIDFDNKIALGRLINAQDETRRKIGDRESREYTARFNEIGRQLRALPYVDKNDPKFAEIVKAAADVNLPVTDRDAKKKIDLKQDQRTGQWTVILTDPVTGKQEARNVEKDGKPFASTPTVVMQGEYGMLRQNDQQAFTAEQNAISRQFRAQLEAAGMQFKLALKQYDTANGRQKTLQQAQTRFVNDFTKANQRPPTQSEIDSYLSAVSGFLDDDQ